MDERDDRASSDSDVPSENKQSTLTEPEKLHAAFHQVISTRLIDSKSI